MREQYEFIITDTDTGRSAAYAVGGPEEGFTIRARHGQDAVEVVGWSDEETALVLFPGETEAAEVPVIELRGV